MGEDLGRLLVLTGLHFSDVYYTYLTKGERSWENVM